MFQGHISPAALGPAERFIELPHTAAGYIVPGSDLLELLRLVTTLAGVWAARRKTTAGLGIDGGDDLTLDDDTLGGMMDVGRGDSRQ